VKNIVEKYDNWQISNVNVSCELYDQQYNDFLDQINSKDVRLVEPEELLYRYPNRRNEKNILNKDNKSRSDRFNITSISDNNEEWVVLMSKGE
jgi:hypothetical protein